MSVGISVLMILVYATACWAGSGPITAGVAALAISLLIRGWIAHRTGQPIS